MRKLNLKNLTAALVVAVSFALPAAAQEASGPILFTNVNVFDGVNEALIENANVLVDGNPLEDLSVLGASPRWFDAEPRGEGHAGIKLIMKDGNIYKNTL